MHVERSRITLLTGSAALVVSIAAGLGRPVRAAGLPEVTVYRSPT